MISGRSGIVPSRKFDWEKRDLESLSEWEIGDIFKKRRQSIPKSDWRIVRDRDVVAGIVGA